MSLSGPGQSKGKEGAPRSHLEWHNPKLCPLPEAVRRRERLRRDGGRLVLVSGAFDLLHPGHLYFLENARRQGDALFVGLARDDAVRAGKGPLRPIQTEAERAYALSALESVDGIFLFAGGFPGAELRALCPEVFAQSGDFCLETLTLSEHEAVLESGCDIRCLPFLSGYSTTEIIRRVHRAADPDSL